MKTKRLDDCINRIKKCKTLESINKIDVYSEKQKIEDCLISMIRTFTLGEDDWGNQNVKFKKNEQEIESERQTIKRDLTIYFDKVLERVYLVQERGFEFEDGFYSKVEELIAYIERERDYESKEKNWGVK